MNFPDLKNPYHFLATLGGVGLLPFAPGTFGSLCAALLFVFLAHFINMTLATLFITVLAIWICETISKDLQIKDHKAIVIDELVGMWISLLPTLFLASQNQRLTYTIVAIFVFRFFDITKPIPISYFDKKFKNGFGIVFDDVLAGIFTIFVACFLSLFLFS